MKITAVIDVISKLPFSRQLIYYIIAALLCQALFSDFLSEVLAASLRQLDYSTIFSKPCQALFDFLFHRFPVWPSVPSAFLDSLNIISFITPFVNRVIVIFLCSGFLLRLSNCYYSQSICAATFFAFSRSYGVA